VVVSIAHGNVRQVRILYSVRGYEDLRVV